jgi:hypothetical protein
MFRLRRAVALSSLVSVLALLPMATVFAYNSNGIGDGSSGSPYQVVACSNLRDIETAPSAYYILMHDLDCSGQTFTDSVVRDPFSGHLNGNRHKLTINVDAPNTNFTGLFQQLAGSASITDLVVDGSVSGGSHAGMLAGNLSDNAQLQHVASYGNLTCNNNCGGLVGSMNDSALIAKSYSSASIHHGSSVAYGGLVGWMNGGGTITNSYYRGTVDAGDKAYTGGLVGYADEGTITKSYASGSVTGGALTGGLVGYAVNSTMSDLFAATEIHSPEPSAGPVTGGVTGGTYGNRFYDAPLSGYSSSPDGSSPVTDSDYFKNNSTNQPFDNWDFSTIWRTNYNDYPSLEPLLDPYMLCEEPQSTNTSITGHCLIEPLGWGTPTWQARWRVKGSSAWNTLSLADIHQARATVTGISPGTDYQLQFRFTNAFGTGNWGTLEIITTGTKPVIAGTTASSTAGQSASVYSLLTATQSNQEQPTVQAQTTPETNSTDASNPSQATTQDVPTLNSTHSSDERAIRKTNWTFIVGGLVVAGCLLIGVIKQRLNHTRPK